MKKYRPFLVLPLLALFLFSVLPGAVARAPAGSLPQVVDAPVLFDRPVPAGADVGAAWFSDAVFLGDSRTTNLKDSNSLEGGLWLSLSGLNVRTARTYSDFSVDGQALSIAQALEGKNYPKIYIALGVNEASWMADADFYAEYAGLIDDLRALLPDASIYIQTILPVTVARAAARSPDNALLSSRNDLLRRLAREKRVYLVDAAAALTAENGALPREYSEDGLHLNPLACQIWADYLKTHTVGK